MDNNSQVLVSNQTSTVVLNCPDFDQEGQVLLDKASFWLEGILQTTLACIGMICNLASILILGTKEMRACSFNLLLIALSAFDSGYLMGSILESFRKSFRLETDLHTYLFPYFLFPGMSIMMTASIFMTVAIAVERYTAVHYPIDYKQSMNDERASMLRTMKFVLPVFIFAVLFNIPKFFEAEITYLPSSPDTPVLKVTDLRKDPLYATYYSSWARLWVTGIIPFILLVWFNYKICKDIQSRVKRRPPRQAVSRASPTLQQENKHASMKSAAASKPTVPDKNGSIKTGNGAAVETSGNNQPTTRRSNEDKLAIIFMSIVLVFLVCHFPRILLSIHEMWIIEDTLKCSKARLPAFPLWALAFSQVSHVLLVINSGTNSFVYCMLSSRFREEAKKNLRELVVRMCPRMTGMFGEQANNNFGGPRSARNCELRLVENQKKQHEGTNQRAGGEEREELQMMVVNADIHEGELANANDTKITLGKTKATTV